MTHFPLKRPWTTKPSYPVGIDRTNHLAKKLKAAYTFTETSGNTVRDITGNGNTMTLVNNPTVGVAEGVRGLTFNGTNQYAYIDASHGLLASSDSFTIAGATRNSAADTDNIFLSMYGPFGAGSDLQMISGTGYAFRDLNTGGSLVLNYGTAQSEKVSFVAVHAPNAQQLYTSINRVHVSGTDTSNSDALPASGRKWLIGTDADSLGTDGDGSLGNWLTGTFEYLYFFDSELTEEEARSLNNNPWQILQPTTQLIDITIPAVGGGFQSAWAIGSSRANMIGNR